MDEIGIMKAVTWIPGTNSELDTLFHNLREKQYSDKSHRLWYNYDSSFVNYCVALSICFEENLPVLCSSIAYRDCWPKEAYRILNRLWKIDSFRKPGATKRMSISFKYIADSQIDWLSKNTNYRLFFISRQTDNWERWVSRQFKQYNINFKQTDYKYLTCPNESDDTCWQNIIYNGDEKILEQWKRRIS